MSVHQSRAEVSRCHSVFCLSWLILLRVEQWRVMQLPAYWIERRQIQTVKELWNVLLSEWRTNCQACFCQLDLIVVEPWRFSADPFNCEALYTYTFLFYLLQLCCVHLLSFPRLLQSVVFYFLPHSCCLLASCSLCFPASLLPLMRISLLRLCLPFFFGSQQFCCFTSVKSAPDVHIIPDNALVINHASLAHQPSCRRTIWPNKWPT